MRLTVDPWDPAYGTAADDAATDSDACVEVDVERPASAWAPLSPPAGGAVPDVVVFVDGVRRVDARVWVEDDNGDAEPGLCASWAAGAVVCDGEARLAAVEVGRGLFSTSSHTVDLVTAQGTYRRVGAGEDLSLALQQRMTLSELSVAAQVASGLLVVDGPLRGRQVRIDAIGMVKTHHRHYLPEPLRPVLRRLAPGQRTPLLRVAAAGFVRHTWYVRLPGDGRAPMAGIVRCECSADVPVAHSVELADWSAAVLPAHASEPHKDSRAPQNLYPIAGLERELRRRLGDARLLYRALRAAAA
jgi:hypothetical protein